MICLVQSLCSGSRSGSEPERCTIDPGGELRVRQGLRAYLQVQGVALADHDDRRQAKSDKGNSFSCVNLNLDHVGGTRGLEGRRLRDGMSGVQLVDGDPA